MSSWLSYFNPWAYGSKPIIEPPLTPTATSADNKSPAPSGVGGVESSMKSALHKTPSRIEFLKDSWNYIQSTTAYKWISPPFIWLWDLGCQIVWTAREIAFSPQRPPTTPPSSPAPGGKDMTPKSKRT